MSGRLRGAAVAAANGPVRTRLPGGGLGKRAWGKPLARLIVALALFLLAMAPALAEIRILSSSGGSVGGYLRLFSQLRQSGQRIVIDGPCYSACTLVLSTIPRSRICVTGRAVLGFHAPRLVDPAGRSFGSRAATRAVTGSYPPGVQAWIKRRGGLTGKPIFLRGRELASLYRRC
jgi:hypothetical protein